MFGRCICALVLLAGGVAFAPGSGAQPPGATLVLPPQVVAGQPATLAVVGADGRLVSGATVEFSGGKRVTTNATGRAAFRAPDEPGVMVARAGESSATTTVLAPAAEAAEALTLVTYPRVVLLGEPFAVHGTGFRGDADANRVHLGNQLAIVLAASPVALVVLPSSAAAPGALPMRVEVGGHSAGSVPTRLIALELVFDKPGLEPGEKARLGVRVRGTEQRLELEIRNLTPGIIRLTGGEVQRVRTRGGPDNRATLTMRGVRAGDFSVSARLVRPATGLPDTEAAREHLAAARQAAPPRAGARLDKLLRLLGESAQNALKVRNELERMLAEAPGGEYGRRLEAAWRALLTP